MATYSRSQTTAQTAKPSSVMPSMDISSLLVKTMENVMNENEEESEKTLEEQISEGINSSDLLKDKTKNDTNKELTDLLKDKKNSDKELSALLKDTNKNSKDSNAEKKKGTVKSNSDKAANTLGKIVTGGVIGSAIAGIMSSKGVGGAVKGAVSGAVTGTGKVAGGLISSAGNITGGAIAGIGKLFGPVGAVIGKFVGTAVATPFKIVGGTITAAIGGLGKLINTPLKELLTKGTLITFVLSQLFVFLEGLMAKFIAQKDVKWIDFMSKLKASISMIPDNIMISLEQVLSKVRILGKPIYGALSKDEKKELKSLERDKDIEAYNDAIEGVNNADRTLNTMASQMGASGVDVKQYNLDTEEGKIAYKAAVIESAKQSHIENGMPELNEEYANAEIDKWLANRDKEKAAAEEKVKSLNIDEEKLNTYLDLKDRSQQALTAEYFNQKKQDLKDEESHKQEQYFAEGLYKLSNKQVKDKNGNLVTRGLTEYEQEYSDSLHAGSMAKVESMHSDAGTTLITKDPTGAERFSANQYKAWTDSIATAIEHGFQNFIGVKVDLKQKFDQHNPTIKK